MLNIELHSILLYKEKAKVKLFKEVVNTVFSDDEIPKESIHYICIANVSISMYSVYK